MAKKQQRENFETVIGKAQITATSNKSDGKYKQKTPTKTVYIVPENDYVLGQHWSVRLGDIEVIDTTN